MSSAAPPSPTADAPSPRRCGVPHALLLGSDTAHNASIGSRQGEHRAPARACRRNRRDKYATSTASRGHRHSYSTGDGAGRNGAKCAATSAATASGPVVSSIWMTGRAWARAVAATCAPRRRSRACRFSRARARSLTSNPASFSRRRSEARANTGVGTSQTARQGSASNGASRSGKKPGPSARIGPVAGSASRSSQARPTRSPQEASARTASAAGVSPSQRSSGRRRSGCAA